MSDITDNPLSDLARAIAHAQYEGFEEYIDARDIVVEAMFPQMWGSTALGFNGGGGQAMTTAYTIILSNNIGCRGYLVYFAGRFAYRVVRPNEKFIGDMKLRRMVEVTESFVYNEVVPNE